MNETMQTILAGVTAFASVLGAICTFWSLIRLYVVEHSVNGMKAELVAATRKDALAEGRADEKTDEAARRDAMAEGRAEGRLDEKTDEAARVSAKASS